MESATSAQSLTAGENRPRVASPSQRAAIEADIGPILVLAGPGSGKTYCLTERIRFLIEQREADASRICAFTFTNKAAGEIAERLEKQLGQRAESVKRGTIHAYCAEILREFGSLVGLQSGFGIADEPYQRSVLRRLGAPAKWQGRALVRFAEHRFRAMPLRSNDATLFRKYEAFLAKRNIVDFDQLVLRTAKLLDEHIDVRDTIGARWDHVLVDEFQDLNPVQYRIIKALGQAHRSVFGVGDDEQSIYSWAGADPSLFKEFVKDFEIVRSLFHLRENRRCPKNVFSLARMLVENNPPLWTQRGEPVVEGESPFDVAALSFESHSEEMAWVIDDLRRDREEHGLAWGDYALLYRKHEIGNFAETSCMVGNVPCRLAPRRALAEDPVVAYVLAALRVIAHPKDQLHREAFLAEVLPRTLIGGARARATERGKTVVAQLDDMLRTLPAKHADAKKIRRAFYSLRNLHALAVKHDTLTSLVEEILSQRVGEYKTVLEDRHEELSDPADERHPEVAAIVDVVAAALAEDRTIALPRMGGVEIALKGILVGMGVRSIALGPRAVMPKDVLHIGPDDAPKLGIALAVFKACQLLSAKDFTNAFRDFTVVDLETTGNDTKKAEIVEIAAVRVRDGQIVGEFHSLVQPRVPIEAGAAKTHGIRAADVEGAPFFEDVWPAFREFCGEDVLVAHNGYQFDFPILRRMAAGLDGGKDLCTYDTLPLARELSTGSAKLTDLAQRFGVNAGQSHRALDDTKTLAKVFVHLNDAKVVRARKTSLVNLLDHLGVALALSDDKKLCDEAKAFRDFTVPFSFGRYSDCLDFYRSERDATPHESIPTLGHVIDRLGGDQVMERVRAAKTADQRYPAAMVRLRRLLALAADAPLELQIREFLERAVLSAWDGTEPERTRVNLLTLHSTKGLEFSRVYVLGVEDAQFLAIGPDKAPSASELEEARRLLYVGMTRTKARLVLTRVKTREGKATGGHRFFDEMGLDPINPVAG